MPELTLDPAGVLYRVATTRGHAGQLYQYAALLGRLKPILDDWIPVHRVGAWMRLCEEIGWVCVPDVVFTRPLIDSPLDGRDRLCTTIASGEVWQPGLVSPEGSELPVFCGWSIDSAEAAHRVGWYPLIVNDRVVDRAWVDVASLGHLLGYPSCCVRAFEECNDWRTRSSYELALDQTASRPHRFANPFARHTPWSWIFHTPCRFDCEATIRYASAVRESMQSTEPSYAESIDVFQRDHVFLVFNENRVYALRGSLLNRRRARYTEVMFLGGIPSEDLYGSILEAGTEVLVERDAVHVYSEDDWRCVIEARLCGPRPEHAMLLVFSS